MKVFCLWECWMLCYQLLKKDPVKGTLSLEILRGWLSTPEGFNVTLDLKKGGENLCTLLWEIVGFITICNKLFIWRSSGRISGLKILCDSLSSRCKYAQQLELIGSVVISQLFRYQLKKETMELMVLLWDCATFPNGAKILLSVDSSISPQQGWPRSLAACLFPWITHEGLPFVYHQLLWYSNAWIHFQ